MSQVAEKTTPLVTALGPRWLEDLRARGAARFAALGLPTVREEDWRFTNVSPIGGIDFVPADPASGTADLLAGVAYADAPARLVIVNGRTVGALSRT
jgi:Fe-S cluster assembly protein SufD